MPRDPIVTDPPDFNQAEVWAACNEAAANCFYPDGEVNWRNAMSADPGVCSCPACHEYYWNLGRVQRCAECGFEYPTDWWSMYSWGCQAARNPRLFVVGNRQHAERMQHAYYRYGFEHPAEDPMKERDQIDWREAISPNSKP